MNLHSVVVEIKTKSDLDQTAESLKRTGQAAKKLGADIGGLSPLMAESARQHYQLAKIFDGGTAALERRVRKEAEYQATIQRGREITAQVEAAKRASLATAEQATASIGKMTSALSGLRGPLGAAASGFGEFGSVLAVFVTGGIAAGIGEALIRGAAYGLSQFGKEAREAKQRTDELITSMLKLREQQLRGPVAELQCTFSQLMTQAQKDREDLERAKIRSTIKLVDPNTDAKVIEAQETLLKTEKARAAVRRELEAIGLKQQEEEIHGLATIIGLGRATTQDLAERTRLEKLLRGELAGSILTLEDRVKKEQQLRELATAGAKQARESARTDAQRAEAQRDSETAQLKVLALQAENYDQQVAIQSELTRVQIEHQVATAFTYEKNVVLRRSKEDQLRSDLQLAALLKQQADEQDRQVKLAKEAERQLVRFIELNKDLLAGLQQPKTYGAGPTNTVKPVTALFDVGDAQRALQIEQDAIRSAKRTAEAFSRAFLDIYRDGRDGFAKFFDEVANIAARTASDVATAFARKDLGLGKFGSGVVGGVLGGATGAAISTIGNDILDLGGKVSKARDELFVQEQQWLRQLEGFADIAKPLDALDQAQRDLHHKFEDTIASWTKDFNAFVDVFHGPVSGRLRITDGGAGLSNATIEQLKAADKEMRSIANHAGSKAVQESARAMAELIENTIQLKGAMDDAAEATRQRFEAEQQAARDNLTIRQLEATGQHDAAVWTRQRLDDEKEVQDAIKAGYDGAYIAQLLATQQMEESWRAVQQAMKEVQQTMKDAADQVARLKQRQEIGEDIAVRQRRLTGDDLGADILAAQFGGAKALRDAQDLFSAGTITADMFQRLIDLVGGETQKTIDGLTKAYEDQIAAAKRLHENLALSLDVMELTAKAGLFDPGSKESEKYLADAERLNRELEKKKQLEDAISSGYTDAELTRLRYIQGLQDEALAQQKLLADQQKHLQLLKEQSDFMQDLQVRALRAKGLDQAADDIDVFNRQKKELEDAIGKGYDKATLDFLRQTQLDERTLRDTQRRQQQQDEFSRAANANFGLTNPFPDSRTTLGLAVGITGSQADRLAGLGTSQLVIQTDMLSELRAIRATINRQQGKGLSLDDVDKWLGGTIDSAERTLGQNPRN